MLERNATVVVAVFVYFFALITKTNHKFGLSF